MAMQYLWIRLTTIKQHNKKFSFIFLFFFYFKLSCFLKNTFESKTPKRELKCYVENRLGVKFQPHVLKSQPRRDFHFLKLRASKETFSRFQIARRSRHQANHCGHKHRGICHFTTDCRREGPFVWRHEADMNNKVLMLAGCFKLRWLLWHVLKMSLIEKVFEWT